MAAFGEAAVSITKFDIGDKVNHHHGSSEVADLPDILDECWAGPYLVVGIDPSGKNYHLQEDSSGQLLPFPFNWRFLKRVH